MTSKTSKRHNGFEKGRGTYRCEVCGKLTRDTGGYECGLDMCGECALKSQLENGHADGYHKEERHPDCPVCQAEVEAAQASAGYGYTVLTAEGKATVMFGEWTSPVPGLAEKISRTVASFEPSYGFPTAHPDHDRLRAELAVEHCGGMIVGRMPKPLASRPPAGAIF